MRHIFVQDAQWQDLFEAYTAVAYIPQEPRFDPDQMTAAPKLSQSKDGAGAAP